VEKFVKELSKELQNKIRNSRQSADDDKVLRKIEYKEL